MVGCEDAREPGGGVDGGGACRELAERDGTTACGLNLEGVLRQVCRGGVWVDAEACTGTDVCIDEARETETCEADGVRERVCLDGAWAAWGDCQITGCTDPGATNHRPEATVDDDSCVYPPSSQAFLEHAQPEVFPGRFPASSCDALTAHHSCVTTAGCRWLRTIKDDGLCRADPVARCLASGDCVCRASDFHGDAAYDVDLEVFLPLSVTWQNLAPRTSAVSGDDRYEVRADVAEIFQESLENFTSRTDFTQRTVEVRARAENALDGLGSSSALSLTLKVMPVWDKAPRRMQGNLLSALGVEVEVVSDQVTVIAGEQRVALSSDDASGRGLKDYQCNQLALVVDGTSATAYLGGVATVIPGLDMATVRAHLMSLDVAQPFLRLGAINAKVWDVRLYGQRALSPAELAEIGKRCGQAGDYAIPDGYPDSNRRYSWGMGGYDIVPGHATQSYSSGVYSTTRVPAEDSFPAVDPVDRDNLKRMVGFWDRWHEQMFFELDFLPYVDRRTLEPSGSRNSYRDFTEADGLGEGQSGSREPHNYNNPCRYTTDLFQAFNWLAEDFPGEPTSADHRKIAERGGWHRWDSYEPDAYNGWGRPVHEHGHAAHFTLMRTYKKVHHYIRGIAGESFAEVMSNYLFAGSRSWLTSGLTYYPTIPLAFEGRWDAAAERHVFKSPQPYQELNIDNQGLGSRFYGLGAWWLFVSHYAGRPYIVGRLAVDTDDTPGTTLQRARFYLEQEGVDLGDLYGNFAAHTVTWDWPKTGHNFHAEEQAPFQGIESWCTTNTGPDCTLDALKIQGDIDPEQGTGGAWAPSPEGVDPGGFAHSTLRIANAPGGARYAISLEFETPAQLYPNTEFHITLSRGCREDPRFFSSRIVVADVGSQGQLERARPRYYKIPGRSVQDFVIEVPAGRPSNVYLVAAPTPPFELEDVRPFVDGFSLRWPYRYKVTRLPADMGAPEPPIELEADQTLPLEATNGRGFVYDCFAEP